MNLFVGLCYSYWFGCLAAATSDVLVLNKLLKSFGMDKNVLGPCRIISTK
jgi:hypothetical protein